MRYDFDSVVSREGWGASKWEAMRTTDGLRPLGIVPFSIADMEFRVAPEIQEALKKTVEMGVLGYTEPTEEYFDAVMRWMERRHNWRIEQEWIQPTYGVVVALLVAVRTLTNPGDGVIIQPPVYRPFRLAIEDNGRRTVENPLKFSSGRYEMDYEDLERKARDPNVTMAILCSPHNPVGRVWTREELGRFAEICRRNNVFVVSDEIHSDLVFAPHVHTPFAALSEADARNSIVCTAPSKTFNLAGLTTSNIIIPNGDVRAAFARQFAVDVHDYNSVFGIPACIAAYNKGEAWMEEMLAYVEQNIREYEAFLKEKFPSVRCIAPEGTYLVWTDFSGLGMDEKELDRFLFDEALFFMDDGPKFGRGGALHRRADLACPRSVLMEALERLDEAAARLGVRR